MNFAFAICCLAAVVVFASAAPEPKTPAEIISEVEIHSKECAEEFKISPETIKELHQSGEKSKIDASDDLKCYSKCFSGKIGIFDGENVNLDRLVEFYVAHGKEESKIRASAAICKDKVFTEKQDCNLSWSMYTCFADNL